MIFTIHMFYYSNCQQLRINFFFLIFLNSMKSKLLFTAFGIGVGVSGHYAYRYYNPQRNVTIAKRQMVSSYTSKNQLQKGYLVSVLKSVGLMLKGFYHYGMDTKIQGFNFNSTYLKKQQMEDDKQDIKHLYCIFSPTDYLCGHPQIQHGGATATIIDQNMGYLAILHSKQMVATGDLHIRYKRPIRKDQFYVLQTEITERKGRKIWVKGVIKQLQTGQVKVESEALFFTVNWDNQMSRILTKFFKVIHYKDYQQLQDRQNKKIIEKQDKKITLNQKKQQIKIINQKMKNQVIINKQIDKKMQKIENIIHTLEEKQKLIHITSPQSSNVYQEGRTA